MQLLKQTSIRTTFRTIQTLVAMLLVLLVAEGMILWNVCEKGSQANHGLIAEGLPSLRTLATFEENLALFKRWEERGVQLDPHGIGSSYAIFYTYDENVAREEGFERFRTESGNQLPRR